MRQNLIAHEKRLIEITATEAHVQMLMENLSLSAATQDGRSTNLEQHVSHISNSVEALRSFQEAHYSGPPRHNVFSDGARPSNTGGGFPIGGGLRGAYGGCGDGGCGGDDHRPRGGLAQGGVGNRDDCHCEHVKRLMTDSEALQKDVAEIKSRKDSGPGSRSFDPWQHPKILTPASGAEKPNPH